MFIEYLGKKIDIYVKIELTFSVVLKGDYLLWFGILN
jgi:hypothetical protein